MTRAFIFVRLLILGSAGLAAGLVLGVRVETSAEQQVRQRTTGSSSAASAAAPPSSHRRLLDRYCVTCHNERFKTAGLRLDEIDVSRPAVEPEVWEKVVRKLRTGIMPPANMPQPASADRGALSTWLETELDAAYAVRPNPGRTETLRRLNRTEYRNAIRDLLALDIDAAALLPPDESGHGFDNVTVSDLPPTLLDRYISAAQKISRLAIGRTQSSLQGDVIRVPADLTQEDQLPGLPIGTRGGVAVPYTFAENGEYDIQVWLAKSLEGNVSGLREPRPHEMIVLIDREPVATFTIQKTANVDDTVVDRDLKARVAVSAGPHELAVTFVKDGSSLQESGRQPLQSHYNDRRHPRIAPAVDQVSVAGPYAPTGAVDTPSRRRLFVCRPAGDEEKCAKTILTTLMRRAYRRPISSADLERPMAFYREGRAPRLADARSGQASGDFEAGIGNALGAVLVNPAFLFRVEPDPEKTPPGGVYRISDLELASRL